MSIEFILAEMVEKRIRAGEVERRRLEDEWNMMMRVQAVEEIERVLGVYEIVYEIGDLQITRYIKDKYPNGNPYAKMST